MGIPEHHATVVRRLRDAISADGRFAGLAAGGSLRAGTLDEFSDVDLILVVEDEHHAEVMAARQELAASWGTLLSAFTGEHVGEPRLLICLYDEPLMHVDLKFLRRDELTPRTEDPVVLWERGDAVSGRLGSTRATPPAVDEQWMEDRFWVWVHYATAKVGRGELLEAVGVLAFLREAVLGPLHLAARGREPRGVRRLEQIDPGFADELRGTVAGPDRGPCAEALWRCVEIYRGLRRAPAPRRSAEQAAVRYLAEVAGVTRPGPGA